MPTGGGKSVCYQLPALLLPGTAIVISPLISLMKDQVMSLTSAGIPAAFINSTLSQEEYRDTVRDLRQGLCKILYVAPERLLGEGFVALMRELTISLVAVDEAHCVSEWGQDFRPSYLKIEEFLEKLPWRPPVAAFTATATERVREDIQRALKLQSPVLTVTGFDRPNLFFEVLKPRDRLAALLALVRERSGESRGKSGIVYCATRANVEKVCAALRKAGIPATRYHAGLSDEERRQNQEDFLYDRTPVMAATNAFGMGIDKSNVSFVIHYNMPRSLEAYYQEAGRAGRDGSPADCILLFSPADIMTARYFIENPSENEELTEEERKRVFEEDVRRLDAMVRYCRSRTCLRGVILDYFGQAHEASCGNCGVCRSQTVQRDVTREAQMVLSCVKRVRDKLGYSVGAALLCDVLRGSRSARVRSLGLDGLSTYGLLRTLSAFRVRELLELLEEQGYIRTDPIHRGIELLSAAGDVLFRSESVVLTEQAQKPVERLGKATERNVPSNQSALSERNALFEALRALRTELARREDVPAYIIFSNATLSAMAERMPRDMTELLEVPGIGEVKARKYGRAFLDAIERWQNNEGKINGEEPEL